MAKPKNSNVKGNNFGSIPKQIREKALHRVATGEPMAAVARDIGVADSTVSRWCKEADITRGCALNPEANPMIVQPDGMMDTFANEVRKQNVEAALSMFLDMQDGVEDKYKVLMAQQLYQVFHRVMQNPPPIRNWNDVDKAHKIMADILGINKAAKGGGVAKIQIEFDNIKGKPTVIDAEEVEVTTTEPSKFVHEEEEAEGGGD